MSVRVRARTPTAPEEDWDDLVASYAALRGWWSHHAHDSRRSRAGLPDRLFVRPPRVVFAELKVPGGRVRPAQQEVLAMLERCPGVECYLWVLPAAWPAVREVLR